MRPQTKPDVENPTDPTCLLDADYGYVPSLPSERQENERQRPSKSILVLVSALLAIGLLVVLIVGNVHIETQPDSDPLVERLNPVEQGVSDKSFSLPSSTSSSEWTTEMLSWQAPAFHFYPEKNWMNDPNGPVYYKGWYHLFYQYSPKAPVWGLIVWGHAVSRDMVRWRHLPIAMDTDQWYDVNGVWTGSTTILPNNKLVVLYTGSTNESVQVQNLAYPANPSDPLLVHWIKDPENPVLVPPPGIGVKDFRDPTTAWLTADDKWRMVIGSKINKTGIALLYDTKDFKSYELQKEWLHDVAGTGMWECVDFYPVSEKDSGLDTGAYGPDVKHVLKASMDDDRCDYYAIGKYDQVAGKWVPDDPKIDVGIGLRYDYGIYYASKTFYDQNQKRRILWSWIKETDSEASDIQKGWASLMAIPRTVALDPATGSNLIQWPIEEIDKLRYDLKIFDEIQLEPGSLVPLSVGPTSQLDIMVEFELGKKVANRLRVGAAVPYNCGGHGGAGMRGALGPFGLLVLANKNLTEHTPAYFYIAKGIRGDLDILFCIDQSRSSIATDVDKSIYGSTVPVLEDEKLSMRILVDHSIVEGYAQGGRTCITSRIYPTEAINDDAQVFLFNNATDINVTASLKIWQMGMRSKNDSGWVWLGPSLILLVVFGFVVWTWQNQRKNNR
ncbi:acid beta-fructofuranosidase 2, vacuolar-like [Cynara cardunculus var. scolymus]|uniref:acid beta-fructofuranosidase 2, vacuolar-like n=1 Tax=Cynara cardunculus var. scolymus TaxID=59895 RepID=UPI000D62DD1F|nr:acid beta-fructofuranosidase 2, vacuolar-like [Cynara cardunculus var. scolymus]